MLGAQQHVGSPFQVLKSKLSTGGPRQNGAAALISFMAGRRGDLR